MSEKSAYIKTGALGFVSGIIGAIIGLYPSVILRPKLINFLVHNYFGGSHKAFHNEAKILSFLVVGYPLVLGAIFFVPIGGAIFGYIGSMIGLKRHSPRLWLWGGIAGFIFSLCVSFHPN